MWKEKFGCTALFALTKIKGVLMKVGGCCDANSILDNQ
jgi:hypothetical protein